MPDSIPLGGGDVMHVEPHMDPDSLSGTNLKSVLKTAEKTAEGAVMGLSVGASRIANTAGVALLVAVGIAGLWQLRSDAIADRADHRAQVERQIKEQAEQRREDRQDRQRVEDLFSKTLETISRDNRESVVQMKIVSEQVKASSDQMKAATESMLRVEKLLTSKSIP